MVVDDGDLTEYEDGDLIWRAQSIERFRRGAPVDTIASEGSELGTLTDRQKRRKTVMCGTSALDGDFEHPLPRT